MTSQQHYSQGLETYRVPMTLYAENREKLVRSLSTKENCGIILLEGGKQETRHDTDHEPIFRQESYFHYLFGTNQPDCFGAVSFSDNSVVVNGGDVSNKKMKLCNVKTVLFVPTWDEEVATVCGESPDFVELAQELGVDEVRDVNDVKGWIEGEMGRLGLKGESNGASNGNGAVNGVENHPKLFVLKGLNTDSGNYAKPAYYDGIDELKRGVKDEETLFHCIAECRVHKVRICLALSCSF